MSSQRSDWRERLHANPSRMEQELAIKLQDDGITYTYSNRTIASWLFSCLVPSCRETRGLFCKLGFGITGFGPCCVWAQLLGSRHVRGCWFWLDPCDVLANRRSRQPGSRIVDSLVCWW